MAEAAGSIERVATELAGVFTRITNKLGDDSVIDTFEQLGVHFPDAFLTEPTISAARLTVYGCGAELRPLTQQLTAAIAAGDQAAIAAASFALITQFGRVVEALPELANALATAGPTLPGITEAQIAELNDNLPRKIVDLLLADILQLSAPASALLLVFGIIERTFVPGDDTNPSKPPHERVSVHLDRILPALTNPVGHLGTLYGWGTDHFDAGRLLLVIETMVAGLGLPVLFTPGAAAEPPRLQIFAFDLEPTADGSGLKVAVMLAGALTTAFSFPVSPPTWNAEIGLSGTLPADASGELRPPLDLKLTPPAGPFEASITAGLKATPPTPFLLLGTAGGSRLEFAGLSATGGVKLTFDPSTGKAGGGPIAEGEVTGGKLIIDTAGGDGFISTLLGQLHLESRFDVGFSFTPEQGLRFHGSGGLEIQVPVHVELGPVQLQAIYLLARIEAGKLPIELSAGLSAKLGPVSAAVDRIGLRADLSFPGNGGNLGPADLAFGFKPPTGVGLSLDVGVVTGGGYLFADPDRGEYAGVLQLEFAKFLAVKAIGLITTRMPDGSSGFSLLLVLTAEFGGVGLQLGYGFKLIAVGGIIGLNRTMRLDALMEGVRTGAIESVMFPRDIVANAPRILSDLRAFFPPQEGTFLIGPMAKLGWGTPTLVSVSLGVIIEIPGNIAIVGVLKVALPTEELPLLILQVNFAGAIEFDRKRIFFFASLFGSRVLTMSINGEMGLLVAYGADPNFVLSVGGFHPSFAPPPLPFPSPRRVSVDVLNSGIGRITISGYFAVTSNTAQFGAQADLFFGFGGFGIEGHIGFDALFQFSPFMFIIEVHASVSLKAFGVGVFSISLRFALSGPTPWRARGTGSISFFFFEISADFDITWGEERDTVLPPVNVMPLLAGELLKPEGWQARPPAGGAPLVTLRALAEAESELVLHPLGTLLVRQRAVPLDIQVDKVGSENAADVSKLAVNPAGTALTKLSDAEEMFALAQFQNMDDAAKLARRAFERQHAGLELSPDGVAMASQRAVRRSARYEQSVIDTITQPDKPSESFVNYNGTLFNHFMAGSSVARSPLAAAQRTLREPAGQRLTVTGDSYVVAQTLNNRRLSGPFTSQALAAQDLADRVADAPALDGTLHVIPASEALS
ncbi:DUF6603 domain-containing protein [Streptomyces sp. HUAS TT20]|uniref:DUF6603 domain-containing protein n=1 Tax=Streptomyces sp. HUAS TT20 TaxID=3447509 RepID=UPI0021DA6A63|nr:DUF6603 domain-containing protein [Streptomyces sp. HUAS 15-9]UXY32071.1 hypothetical protein N8I87_39655 [Streptomyces sp. HUAS 15-9]